MANVAHATGATQAAGLAEPGAKTATRCSLDHPALVRLLQRAYSAERAASFAYIGHAASLRDPQAKSAVKQIEDDEWAHRRHVLAIMRRYGVPVSRWFEGYYYVVGKLIGVSCHVIGRFMPYFFAGKLESGNVCEYFVMMRHFHTLGITEHDAVLHEMGIKEKEHEVYFLAQIENCRWLPWFERVFAWGKNASRNDVDLARKHAVEDSHLYCANYHRSPSDDDLANR
ncbi:MAG: ferritin-like domain-containing protein [Opitutaceae bacterium]|nr:ferritin-like domain-containing protein [Opitutaceae bacterium]